MTKTRKITFSILFSSSFSFDLFCILIQQKFSLFITIYLIMNKFYIGSFLKVTKLHKFKIVLFDWFPVEIFYDLL